MYSDLAVQEITPLTGALTEVPHPDGQGLVLIQRPDPGDGTIYFVIDPWGGKRWSADQGSWERFFPYGGGWMAYREDTHRLFYVTRVPKLPYMP